MYREAVIKFAAHLIIETQSGKLNWKRRCYNDTQRHRVRDVPYGGMLFSADWKGCKLQLYRIFCPGQYTGEKPGESKTSPTDFDFLFKIALDIVDENGEIEYILEPVYAMVSLFNTVQALCSPSLKKIEAVIKP